MINWSAWRIGTKILVSFLALSLLAMGVTGYVSIVNITALGDHAEQTTASLGKKAIEGSIVHLNRLGEDIILQKATNVAGQVELYLNAHPTLTVTNMRVDSELRQIVVQPVGLTGYTALIDTANTTIVIHKYPEQEKPFSSLRYSLPRFWALYEYSLIRAASGYYDWLEVDGTLTRKYAAIVPIKNPGGNSLTLWATTYIDEFSLPVEQTRHEISAAIQESNDYINKSVTDVIQTFSVIIAALIIFVTGLALLLSKIITTPIRVLKSGAESIGQGNLSYQLQINNKDELGDLANAFNKMSLALKNYMEELQNTAAENIANEKQLHSNLRMYIKKVGEAQEAERKRIARELHDDTLQALVAVVRHLDDLAAGKSKSSAQNIRLEVQRILESVRHFSQELRPSIIDDLGLIPALKWLSSELKKNQGIDVAMEISGSNYHLPAEVELMLFRITQEAFSNIRKHSKAIRVSVKLELSRYNVRVSIQDNGIGFNMPARLADLTRTGRLGLVGMEERVQLLDGTIKIESKLNQGTALSIEVPLGKYQEKQETGGQEGIQN